jgi:hypothetical protein
VLVVGYNTLTEDPGDLAHLISTCFRACLQGSDGTWFRPDIVRDFALTRSGVLTHEIKGGTLLGYTGSARAARLILIFAYGWGSPHSTSVNLRAWGNLRSRGNPVCRLGTKQSTNSVPAFGQAPGGHEPHLPLKQQCCRVDNCL